jgi:hypothetical protein
MKKIIVKLRFIYLALRAIFKLNLGDEVIYNKEKYTTIQGAADPHWDIINEQNNRKNHIHKKNFKKIISWKNIKHDITFIYNFYMRYWYDILLRKPYKHIFSFDCSK